MMTWSNLRMDSSEQEDQFHPLQCCWARKRTISLNPGGGPTCLTPNPKTTPSPRDWAGRLHLWKNIFAIPCPKCRRVVIVRATGSLLLLSRAAGKLPEFTPKPFTSNAGNVGNYSKFRSWDDVGLRIDSRSQGPRSSGLFAPEIRARSGSIKII